MGATIAGTMTAQVLPQGENGIEHPKEIAEEVLGGEGEEKVDTRKNGKEGECVEYGLACGQGTSHLVEGGECEYHDEPGQEEEKGKHGGLTKGVECGVEVKLDPNVRHEHLYGGVEHGGCGE